MFDKKKVKNDYSFLMSFGQNSGIHDYTQNNLEHILAQYLAQTYKPKRKTDISRWRSTKYATMGWALRHPTGSMVAY